MVPFTPTLWGRALQQSALARYLAYNLSLGSLCQRLFGNANYVGNVAAQADTLRAQQSKEAVQHFLSVLPRYSGLPPERIAIVVDGMRPNLYDKAALEATQGSYFAVMRSFLLQVSKEMGYHVIDMQPRFIDRHIMDQARFEWPFDGHWNSKGHEEAALAVINSGFLKRSMAPFNRH